MTVQDAAQSPAADGATPGATPVPVPGHAASTPSGAGSANLDEWNNMATFWDATLAEGNDMFTQLILPTVEELAAPRPGQAVLDLGTGNGIVARRLAAPGVRVLATDYAPSQVEHARRRTEGTGKIVEFEVLDLLSREDLAAFADRHAEAFDIVTGSMLLKELSDLTPMAEFLPKVLKPGGRVIMANLHPCFHKPAAHRVMEVAENPNTGIQEIHTSIKVTRYLNIPPVNSQALRGQPEPLIWFHRPIQDLLDPFFEAGLVLNKVREPSFRDGEDPSQIQSYHNFPQIPMQFIFRLVKVA